MKDQYLLFAGLTYYPGGGWEDFVAAFDSLDEATRFIPAFDCDWMHIVFLGDKEAPVFVRRKKYVGEKQMWVVEKQPV